VEISNPTTTQHSAAHLLAHDYKTVAVKRKQKSLIMLRNSPNEKQKS